MDSLKDQLEREVPWLASESGFKVVFASYDPKTFGDSMVVLQSRALRLRIIRERGRIFAEVSPLEKPELWWDLGLILGVTCAKAPLPHDLLGVTALLRNNLTAITRALGPMLAQTEREIE